MKTHPRKAVKKAVRKVTPAVPHVELSAERVREIVREEIDGALRVLLEAVRRTQPGQGVGLHQAWIDLVMDPNSDVYQRLRAPSRSDWRPFETLPVRVYARLRAPGQPEVMGGYLGHDDCLVDAASGRPIPWRPTEWQEILAS